VLDSVDSLHIQHLLENCHCPRGLGRKPYDLLSMLEAELLKHLLCISSDPRLALRLKNERKAAWVCGFEKRTPSHGLFTHFRSRLREETYLKIFRELVWDRCEELPYLFCCVVYSSLAIDRYANRLVAYVPPRRAGQRILSIDGAIRKQHTEELHSRRFPSIQIRRSNVFHR